MATKATKFLYLLYRNFFNEKKRKLYVFTFFNVKKKNSINSKTKMFLVATPSEVPKIGASDGN